MIYIHIPFCRSFCTYCDFYSEICREEDSRRVQSFLEGLLAEIDSRREEIAASGAVDTLYIGGGTPSTLPVEALDKILTALGRRDFREFTVEVNPDDITGEYASGLRSLGVNRVSMGVQSFDDGILRWMNRRHDSAEVAEAFMALRQAGFNNISLDIIFGISHLSDDTLLGTLEKVKELDPEHVSAYQLSIEEGSTLASMVRNGKYEEASQEQCARQYELICRSLGGYNHYEISNWAKAGFEAVHNSAYWTRAPYVGLGPGAHSLTLDGPRQVRSWNNSVLSGWTSSSEVLSEMEIAEETIMLHLRTEAGIPMRRLTDLAGEEKVAEMIKEKRLEVVSDRIRIPESRFFVSDDIISSLI